MTGGDEKRGLNQMTKREELQELLQRLAQAIYSTISDSLAKKTLQPQYEPYFKWQLTKFEERDDGIIHWGASGKEFLKPYWGRAIDYVYEAIKRLTLYNDTLMAISKRYTLQEDQCHSYLEALIGRIAGNALTRSTKIPADYSKYIDSFLRDLNGEEQEYSAETKLSGMMLKPKSIKLDSKTKLRKPLRKDFETEVFARFPRDQTHPRTTPTAFLHTRICAKAQSGLDFAVSTALQNEIDKGIGILRLFRVGAVQYLQYTMDTSSIVKPVLGTLTSGTLPGPDKYLITKDDIRPLKKYWTKMAVVKLPASIYTTIQKEPDELSIAYDRYSDSLEGGIMEKRVSNAVMGLEALYLQGGEQQEMSYRLRMRVGKLLSLVGYNPSEIQERMKDAYEVRSKYVHGGLLKSKGSRKLEGKYGDINEFTKTIINYLRASIVALLNRPSKNTIIRRLDESLLDNTREDEIRNILFMPCEKEGC